jgi:hypothetical protein
VSSITFSIIFLISIKNNYRVNQDPEFSMFWDRSLYLALTRVVSSKISDDFDLRVKSNKMDLFLSSGCLFQVGDGYRSRDSYIPPL